MALILVGVLLSSLAIDMGVPLSDLPHAVQPTIAAIDMYLQTASQPQIVRISFHDCVGGCDGCVDVTKEENAPLADISNSMTELYESIPDKTLFGRHLSRADFWALIGIRAVRAAILASRPNTAFEKLGTSIEFRMGRKTCTGGNNADESESQFPSGVESWGHVKTIFGPSGFGFTNKEIVTLMGAHSLGGLEADENGFEGRWDTTPHVIDNEYYREMIKATNEYSVEEVQFLHFSAHHQWNALVDFDDTDDLEGGERRIMLSSDMCLLKSFTVSQADGSDVSCEYDSCPDNSETASYVRAYAADHDAFIADFGPVYSKMLEIGYKQGELEDPDNDSSSETNQDVIIGAVVGSVGGAFVIAGAAMWIIRQKRTSSVTPAPSTNEQKAVAVMMA